MSVAWLAVSLAMGVLGDCVFVWGVWRFAVRPWLKRFVEELVANNLRAHELGAHGFGRRTSDRPSANVAPFRPAS